MSRQSPPSLALLQHQAMECHACVLATTRTTVVFGEGSSSAEVMFIGEGPGRDEDESGRPFVGRSGKLLTRLIEEELHRTRGEVYIANVVKCRPPQNRNPEPNEIASCAPYLAGQIAAIDPKVIVTLGAFATRAVLKVSTGITALRGRAYLVDGRTVVPTYHPAAGLRGGPRVVTEMRADLALAVLVLRGEAVAE
ncbi:MAG: uracil-DNA glycosylase [Acidimicrobiales bacterium]